MSRDSQYAFVLSERMRQEMEALITTLLLHVFGSAWLGGKGTIINYSVIFSSLKERVVWWSEKLGMWDKERITNTFCPHICDVFFIFFLLSLLIQVN